MTTINDQLGLRRAGKRSMMKSLPKNRIDAAKITSAECPSCHTVGKAKISATQPGSLYCTWCNTVFEPVGELRGDPVAERGDSDRPRDQTS